MPPVRESGSRHFMSNPHPGDKCSNATAAMHTFIALPPRRAANKRAASRAWREAEAKSLGLGRGVLCGLLAIGHEFLAFLAVYALGIGFLRAFERSRGSGFLDLL